MRTAALLIASVTLASAARNVSLLTQLTPLDIYVNTPDPEYSWSLTDNTIEGPGFTMYTLSLTSQRWGVGFVLPEFELWRHQLVVVIPEDAVTTSFAHLLISGGSSSNGPPTPDSRDVQIAIAVATASGTITAVLKQVPNQPMRFIDSPTVDREEDDTIAHTWRYYMDAPNPNPEFLLRFPMTKAAARAMDAVEAFAAQEFSIGIRDWAVSGASKRGWTSWTTAAVDRRVVAAIPTVMDLLGARDAAKHMYRMLNGAWTFAFNDYVSADLLAQLDDPRQTELFGLVDPISFLERYDDLPVLCVTTGNDQFFMPDNTALWSDQFYERRSPLYLRQYPNCEHSMRNCIDDIVSDYAAFLDTLTRTDDTKLPKYTTSIDDVDGTITVKPKRRRWGGHYYGLSCKDRDHQKPILSARVWTAISANNDRNMKDFRANALTALNTPPVIDQDVFWSSRPLFPNSEGNYVAKVDAPNGRWAAFFIELEFEGAGPGRPTQRYTSETSIVPRTFPAETCVGEQCRGLGLV